MLLGEVSEWFKEPVLKTGDPARDRGFESHLLRQAAERLQCLWVNGNEFKSFAYLNAYRLGCYKQTADTQ